MALTDTAAGVGTKVALAGLKAARARMGKRRYKRFIATAVAEMLQLLPGVGPRKARRRARRVTGVRPSKKLVKAVGRLGWKEGMEGAAAAVGAAGVSKVVGAVGEKVKEKIESPDAEAGAEGNGVATSVRRRSRSRTKA